MELKENSFLSSPDYKQDKGNDSLHFQNWPSFIQKHINKHSSSAREATQQIDTVMEELTGYASPSEPQIPSTPSNGIWQSPYDLTASFSELSTNSALKESLYLSINTRSAHINTLKALKTDLEEGKISSLDAKKQIDAVLESQRRNASGLNDEIKRTEFDKAYAEEKDEVSNAARRMLDLITEIIPAYPNTVMKSARIDLLDELEYGNVVHSRQKESAGLIAMIDKLEKGTIDLESASEHINQTIETVFSLADNDRKLIERVAKQITQGQGRPEKITPSPQQDVTFMLSQIPD
jgi:hypothetical protein